MAQKKKQATAAGKRKTATGSEQVSGSSVRTVMVAAKVLEAFADFRGPVRITDLARALKMTMPRASRHVATLRALGFVEKAEPMEAYRLGIKLFTLGQIALEQNSLASVAYPHLTSLRDKLDVTVLLASSTNGGASVLTCIPSKNAITIMVRPGTVLKFPFSPAARIFHTFTPHPDTTIDDIMHSTEGNVSVDRSYVEARINFILANFYDFEADPRGTGLGAVSAPVFDSENHIIGAVSLMVPSQSLAGNGPGENSVKAIQDAAMRISSAMGSTAWSTRQNKK